MMLYFFLINFLIQYLAWVHLVTISAWLRHLILGRLLKGPASLPCLVLLVMLVTEPKILVVKEGTSSDWSICVDGLRAVSACLLLGS
jgi:hypothetical protein